MGPPSSATHGGRGRVGVMVGPGHPLMAPARATATDATATTPSTVVDPFICFPFRDDPGGSSLVSRYRLIGTGTGTMTVLLVSAPVFAFVTMAQTAHLVPFIARVTLAIRAIAATGISAIAG